MSNYELPSFRLGSSQQLRQAGQHTLAPPAPLRRGRRRRAGARCAWPVAQNGAPGKRRRVWAASAATMPRGRKLSTCPCHRHEAAAGTHRHSGDASFRSAQSLSHVAPQSMCVSLHVLSPPYGWHTSCGPQLLRGQNHTTAPVLRALENPHLSIAEALQSPPLTRTSSAAGRTAPAPSARHLPVTHAAGYVVGTAA